LDRYATQDLYSKLDQAGIDRMNELFNAKNQAWQNYKAKLNTNVPDAPYKKNWHELMMKQVFNEAVKGNYDAVAFTTGRQQAERYNLSKQIDSIDLIPAKEGDKQYVMQAWKNGNNVIRKAVNEDELPDLIGKEAAKKLMEQNPTCTGIASRRPLTILPGPTATTVPMLSTSLLLTMMVVLKMRLSGRITILFPSGFNIKSVLAIATTPIGCFG